MERAQCEDQGELTTICKHKRHIAFSEEELEADCTVASPGEECVLFCGWGLAEGPPTPVNTGKQVASEGPVTQWLRPVLRSARSSKTARLWRPKGRPKTLWPVGSPWATAGNSHRAELARPFPVQSPAPRADGDPR